MSGAYGTAGKIGHSHLFPPASLVVRAGKVIGDCPPCSRDAGFSLIELTTALFVLTVGLMGTIQMYHFGMDKMRTMRESAIAVRTIQNEVETLRAMPFAQLTDRENAPFVSAPDGLDSLVHATPSLAIRRHPDPALFLKEVTVSLRWSGDNGRTMKRAVTTLIADTEAAKP